MQIHVRFFAAAREAAGCAEEIAELPDASRIDDLRTWLLARHPALAPVEAGLRYAIHEDFVALDAPLQDGAQVALIPPVGGG
jgi:molybdopterin converting factor subunit 1